MSWAPGSLLRLCCTATLLGGLPAHAADKPLPPHTKASYILNFTRYAAWPDSNTSTNTSTTASRPLLVCLAGPDAADIARQLEQRAAGPRLLQPLVLTRAEDADHCNALYIGLGARLQTALLARLRDHPVLTIGDSATFLAEGGIIHMTQGADGIHFEISLDAARRAGLSLNPRLLALAERVLEADK